MCVLAQACSINIRWSLRAELAQENQTPSRQTSLGSYAWDGIPQSRHMIWMCVLYMAWWKIYFTQDKLRHTFICAYEVVHPLNMGNSTKGTLKLWKWCSTPPIDFHPDRLHKFCQPLTPALVSKQPLAQPLISICNMLSSWKPPNFGSGWMSCIKVC